MKEGKKFRKSLFGFKTSDVSSYIEKVAKDYNDNLGVKETKIIELKDNLRVKEQELKTLQKETSGVLEQKEKISSALIQAQEKAEATINEAVSKAEEEKKEIEIKIEEEKEKLVDIKRELVSLKEVALSAINKYNDNIDELIKANPSEDEEEKDPEIIDLSDY